MDDQTIWICNCFHSNQEQCLKLYEFTKSNDSHSFYQLNRRMYTELTQVLQQLKEMADTSGAQKTLPICQSILDTLNRLVGQYRNDAELRMKKVEFELLPLLQEAYWTFYFFKYLTDHPEHLPEYYANEKNLLCSNSYIDQAVETRKYRYEVSIFVLAYNKLDYTRLCVENLLANIPEGLNYELILVNHGSNDKTKEYFESIHPHKQLDIAVNGGGMAAFARIVEGEFTIMISNDVIVTPHTIENLLACIRSDPKIAWVVPTTPNISNLQTIPAQYKTQEDLMYFAQSNNCLDPFRWEQRVRLCNPIDIRRNSVFYASTGLCLNGTYHTMHQTHSSSFPDDRVSLLLRRNGHKMMLAKDAYCHHFGSVTLKDEIARQNEQKYYTEGRQEFYKAFGVDPWGTGFCFDPVFQERVVGEDHGHTEILGVNCGLGSNSLKIKEQIKEYSHNIDTCLSNVTDDPRFLADLRGVSNTAETISTIKEWKEFLKDRTYQYIVWETPFLVKYKFKTLLGCCMDKLSPGGKLIIKLTEQTRELISREFPNRRELGNDWVVCGYGEKK